MSKKWRLNDRTRMLLTLELAIALPAAALMGFSIWNLKHIQRDKAIEAAIQRDFQYVLKIAEKRSMEKAGEMVTSAQKEFPCPDDSTVIKSKLERMLENHPEFAYAVQYDKKNNLLLSRSQPTRDADQVFRKHVEEDITMASKWLPMEAAGMVKHVRVMAEKEELPAGFYGGGEELVKETTPFESHYFVTSDIALDGGAGRGVLLPTRELTEKAFSALRRGG